MPSLAPTPRTDAVAFDAGEMHAHPSKITVLCRELERELAAMPKVSAAKQHGWPRLVVEMPYGGATAYFDPCDHIAGALIHFLAERA